MGQGGDYLCDRVAAGECGAALAESWGLMFQIVVIAVLAWAVWSAGAAIVRWWRAR